MLTTEDIEIIAKQRGQGNRHKEREDWRQQQSRRQTEKYSSISTTAKAGVFLAMLEKITLLCTPHFDTNRNDVWSKRMNTLRRFISCVSRWLVRKRLTRRMGRLRDTFQVLSLYYTIGCHSIFL